MTKSYKGFILWIVFYTAGFCPIIAIDNVSGEILTRLTLLYTACALTALAYIIYKTDKIYWYNGVSFKEAEAAGYERRLEYTCRHLVKFRNFTVFYAVFTAWSIYLGFHIFIDSIVFTAGLITTAVSTIKIKL